MPRKSQTVSNRSLSQTQKNPRSQNVGNVSLNQDDQVNDLVRYFVNRAGEQVIFKRTDLKKNVLPKSGQYFQDILNRAVKILEQVYGYKVIVIDAKQNSTKGYIITNALAYKSDPTEKVIPGSYPDDVHKILILLILSHIFMSNNLVSDQSLYAFLKTFGLDVETRHEIFGSIKDFITNLKNKKYIEMEIDQISKKASISWGSRAEKEISKHEILKFVCKMYKTTTPNSWINQYKSANEQHFENENGVEDKATQNTQEE
ncbi:melanoma-associated antigen D2-like [Diorhabda sublineata]|uniref:melanoma-associated antigen D2-like n=1 Tax=Diorhabda sublineata TaxID=1163346 RepID=UPI0024E05C87|nr:melanoma-associated antigen D2-like [Diorhabda sublineata]